MLIEFGLVRAPHRSSRLLTVTANTFLALVFLTGRAHAQVIEITPLPTESPSADLAPGTQWVYWMAIGAGVIVVLVLLAVAAGYMRFAPKFFAREEKPRAMPPGMRPPTLVRQAAQIRYTPPPATERAAPAAQAPARAATATAVAERPATAPAAATEAAPAAQATDETTAPPAGEPAAQADAVGQAEAAAPEARPSAKTAEEVGAPSEQAAAESAPTEAEPAPAEAEPAPAEAKAEPAPAEVKAEPAAAEVKAEPAPAQPAPAAVRAGGEMDQETFDRVLKEQLDRGVDRRVAEGRARAAAVVAARKKSQG